MLHTLLNRKHDFHYKSLVYLCASESYTVPSCSTSAIHHVTCVKNPVKIIFVQTLNDNFTLNRPPMFI